MEIRRKAKHNDGEVGGRKRETNMDTDTVNQEEGRYREDKRNKE
jgi:hypothetical protein